MALIHLTIWMQRLVPMPATVMQNDVEVPLLRWERTQQGGVTRETSGAGMEPKAEADCVLKVDVQCDECKMKLMEVLSSISGKICIFFSSLSVVVGIACHSRIPEGSMVTEYTPSQ
nr:Heavy metal-associated isoprenylated plant protein [Ipomoea trifida]